MTFKTDQQPETILVVDDASDNISILKKILGREYLIRPAISGKVALKAVMVEPFPNLVLLDVMMPEMDGYSVCQELKRNVHTRDIPVIFVTGKTDDEDEIRGLELGAVDYITKPLRPAIVRARVKTHLAMHAAHTQLLELNKTLKDLVTIDGLTGIPNRRRFDEYLQQEWNRS
ncbi:MAG: response regulator, partial [Magnetococcus sp. XQGC-1]